MVTVVWQLLLEGWNQLGVFLEGIKSMPVSDRIVAVVLLVVVTAVLISLVFALYQLATTVHARLVYEEKMVLPMLINSPLRLFFISIFSVFSFLVLLFEFASWVGSLWSI